MPSERGASTRAHTHIHTHTHKHTQTHTHTQLNPIEEIEDLMDRMFSIECVLYRMCSLTLHVYQEIEDLMDQSSTLIKAVKEQLKELDMEGKEHAKK